MLHSQLYPPWIIGPLIFLRWHHAFQQDLYCMHVLKDKWLHVFQIKSGLKTLTENAAPEAVVSSEVFLCS